MQTVTASRADDRLGRPAARMLIAATLSRTAATAATVAVALLVILRTGDTRLAGLTVGAFALPSLVTGPVLGALLDRLRAKRALFVANQLVLAATLGAVLLLAGRAPGAVLIGLGLLAGLTAPVLTGGFSSILPRIVPATRLPRANAADAASYNVASLGGPAMVSAAASVAGAGSALAGTAVLALLAAAFVVTVRMPTGPSSGSTRNGGAQSLPAALRDGVRLLVRVPLLRSTTIATTVSSTAQGLLPVTMPLLAIEFGQPAGHGGWLLTATSCGALVGALASEHLLARMTPRTLLIGALTGYGTSLVAVATAGSLAVALPLAGLAGLASGPVLAATLAVRQRCTPEQHYAQIAATPKMLFQVQLNLL